MRMVLHKSTSSGHKGTLTPLDKARRNARWSKVIVRLIGSMGIIASLSMLVQGVPLLFIFLGGIMGISPDADINSMDVMIWLLTSITVMVFVLYVYIAWMKFLWQRFMVNAKPLFQFKRN